MLRLARSIAVESPVAADASRRLVPLTLSICRLGVGAAFAVKPVSSLRLLGVDSITAARLEWLARMTAFRDVAIGLGTLSAIGAKGGGRDVTRWVLSGAVCDLLDAAAVGHALTRKTVATAPAAAEMAVAVAASVAGLRWIASNRWGRDPGNTA
jgi:hypothetical protein